MKATIIGVSRMSGIGKESKAAYDMLRVLVLSPIQSFQKENFKREGFGFEVVEVEAAPEALPVLQKLTFPFSGVLDIDQVVRGGKLTSVITGVQPKAA